MMKDDKHELLKDGKRLHPLWIPFEIVKSIYGLIIPIIIFFVVNSGEPSMFTRIAQIAVIVIFVFMLVSLVFKWINFRYSFSGDEIRVNIGCALKLAGHPSCAIDDLNSSLLSFWSCDS